MHPIIEKTFGGLSVQYYFRQFFFGAVIAVISFYNDTGNIWKSEFANILYFIFLSVLYPYSRFVYESIANFIMGENAFIANVLVVFAIKLISMLVCFYCAPFIAPFGLAYLYYHHSKTPLENSAEETSESEN